MNAESTSDEQTKPTNRDEPTAPDSDEEEVGFKEKLEEIDEILETLQSGDLQLEESLELYETSIGLLRDCKEILNRSEEKIELLKKEGEDILTEPFDPEEESDGQE